MCHFLIILLLPVLLRLFTPVASVWKQYYITGYTAHLFPPLWLGTLWPQLELDHSESVYATEIGKCYQLGLDLCLLQYLESLDLIKKVMGKM